MTLFRLSGNLIIATKGLSIFNTLKALGVEFARFCHHESLPLAGNCRACLMEVTNFEKPVVACTSDLEVNQSLWPESLFTQKCKKTIIDSFFTLLTAGTGDTPLFTVAFLAIYGSLILFYTAWALKTPVAYRLKQGWLIWFYACAVLLILHLITTLNFFVALSLYSYTCFFFCGLIF